MEKISSNDNIITKIKLINNVKNWKKPVLLQLDIKQTLVGDCGSGMHWDDNTNSGAGGCVPG